MFVLDASRLRASRGRWPASRAVPRRSSQRPASRSPGRSGSGARASCPSGPSGHARGRRTAEPAPRPDRACAVTNRYLKRAFDAAREPVFAANASPPLAPSKIRVGKVVLCSGSTIRDGWVANRARSDGRVLLVSKGAQPLQRLRWLRRGVRHNQMPETKSTSGARAIKAFCRAGIETLR